MVRSRSLFTLTLANFELTSLRSNSGTCLEILGISNSLNLGGLRWDWLLSDRSPSLSLFPILFRLLRPLDSSAAIDLRRTRSPLSPSLSILDGYLLAVLSLRLFIAGLKLCLLLFYLYHFSFASYLFLHNSLVPSLSHDDKALDDGLFSR